MVYFDNFDNLYSQYTRSFIQEQYKFVYDTLEEFVVCGTSWFPVAELSQRLKQKSIKNPITKMNEYQREYQQICKQTPRFTIGDCAGGHRADNREKNRDVLVVPREFQLGCFNSRDRQSFDKQLFHAVQINLLLCYSGQLSTVPHQLSGQQFHGLHQRRLCGCKSVK